MTTKQGKSNNILPFRTLTKDVFSRYRMTTYSKATLSYTLMQA